VVIAALIAGARVVLTRSSGPSLSGLTAAQILDKSLTAARKAGTVHVADAEGDTKSTRQGSFDLSPNGGTETVTVDGGTAQVIEVGGQLYFQADATYWSSHFDLPKSVTDQLGGKWVNVPTNSDAMKQAAAVLKMPTIVDQLLALSGVISKGPAPAKDEVALTGTVPFNDFNKDSGAGDSATVVVSAKSPFLPISISFSDPDNGSTTMTFSKWGEPVALVPPQSPLSAPAGAFGGGSSSGTQSSASASPASQIAPVTLSSTTPGVAVTPAEATSVATQLWNDRTQILATQNGRALGTIDSGPAYEADLAFLCGCQSPAYTLDKIRVTVTRQASWPAVIFATASYTSDCRASESPCDDTFVATQQAPNAAWHIVLVASWSGTVNATLPPAGADGFSPAPNPPAAAHLSTLPSEYAAYLQAIKDKGAAPAGSRLGPGPFTDQEISTNYLPPAQEQAEGLVATTTYSALSSDPVWQFAGGNGTTATCGTVRYTGQYRPTTGKALSQTAQSGLFGNLAPGSYQSVTQKGLHMACFESKSDAAAPVLVFGSWGETTAWTGVPATGPTPTTLG
jgi:hypothetical protein